MNDTCTKLSAGPFSLWLRNIREALSEKKGISVPCGKCTACCRSSFFIYINGHETQTLNQIPSKFLFPAPFHPPGYKVLGYNQEGCCPMLVKNACSIYRNRPHACRYFDCRILHACGLETDEVMNGPVFQQARRWEFSYPHPRDFTLQTAVRDAARFLRTHPKCVESHIIPRDAIQLSVIAIKVFDVFLKSLRSENDGPRSTQKISKSICRSYEKFEKQRRIA